MTQERGQAPIVAKALARVQMTLPGTMKIHRVGELFHAKSVKALSFHVGGIWEFGEEDARHTFRAIRRREYVRILKPPSVQKWPFHLTDIYVYSFTFRMMVVPGSFYHPRFLESFVTKNVARLAKKCGV
ncbi:hypothetical protein TNCV_635621 [Trichonephila clavipes]|nr:hypothetical protein TNCV_635621 [Trichonephila clavipes]